MNTFARLKVAVLLPMATIVACSSVTVAPHVPPNPAVIVLPGATEIRWHDMYDGQVSYQIGQPYPGQQTIDEVRQRLQSLGWHRRDRDFLNPTRSSTVGKWGLIQMDGRDVSAWSEQWENGAGEVVWYGLRYFGNAKDNPQGPMDVLVSYFRADTVKAMQDGVQRQ